MSNTTNTLPIPPPPPLAADEPRTCWVCLASEDDAPKEEWVRPCGCRGTTKWVHQICLNRWIDEKQKGNSMAKVLCPQCNVAYAFSLPQINNMVRLLDFAEKYISKSCPYIAGGLFVGAGYWSAVTYGAITVMQVMGHKEGLSLMEESDPLLLLLGLPTIPVGLVLAKMTRWEDYILHLYRTYWQPYFGSTPVKNLNRVSMHPGSVADPVSATRVVVGAMMWPTIATIIGQLMFKKQRNNFRRTMFGGFSFFLLKGLLKLYYKQQQYRRQVQRTVLDFEEAKRQEELASDTRTA